MAAFMKFWTRAGPLVGMGALCVGSVVVSLPDTLSLSRYQGILAQHKEGKECPLSDKVRSMADKIVMGMNLRPEDEAGLDFFCCYGNNPVHKGSIKLNTGAIIGLPASFDYNSVGEVTRDTFQIHLTPVDWDTPAGQLLQSSLYQSDKAISFIIAREVNYTNTHHVWINAFMMVGFGWLSYALGFSASRLLQLQKRMKLWGRGIFYSIFGVTGFLLYIFMNDNYMCYRDKKVDRKTASLGADYLEGGIEYYHKLLQRNQALRLLMGAEGKKVYTAYGNERVMWRQPHVQISSRRDNLISLHKSMEDKKKESEESLSDV